MITRSILLIASIGMLAYIGPSPDDGTGRLELDAAIATSIEAVEDNQQARADYERITSSAAVVATATRGTAVQVETTIATTTTTLPRWISSIPEYYGPGSGCSQDEADIIARAFWSRGASDDTVMWALGMISRESTCDSAAHNGNRRTGDDSWGLCQINALAGHFSSNGIVAWYDRFRFAVDFGYNADACAHLWSVCGRGPWNYGDYYCEQPTS